MTTVNAQEIAGSMSEYTPQPSPGAAPEPGDNAPFIPPLPSEDTAAETSTTAEPNAGAGAQPQSGGAASQRRTFRRVLAKAQEVAEATPQAREIAASLLGCSTETQDLTLTIMCAERPPAHTIRDLDRILEAHPVEVATIATALGRDRLRAVWSLLEALGHAPANVFPAAPSKAGLALAKTTTTLDVVAVRNQLAGVTAMLKRS